MKCGICSKEFSTYEGMREPSPRDSAYWCERCQDEFDAIDWEEVYNRRYE